MGFDELGAFNEPVEAFFSLLNYF